MTRLPVLTRTHLLNVLRGAPGHVLLCAPSGFGKSVLLHQYQAQRPGARLVTARVGDGPEQVVARALQGGDEALPGSCGLFGTPGLQALLVDDAWRLSREVLAALLLWAEECGVRLLLAVRHTHYPRVHVLQSRGRLLMLDANDLAFTPEELLRLTPQQGTRDAYAETLGWPHPSTHFLDPLFSPREYLQDLLSDLEPDVRTQLQRAPVLEVWDAHLSRLRQRDDGAFEAVMNSGLPIVPVANDLHLHPYLRSYLLTLGGSPGPTPEDRAQALLHVVASLDQVTAVTTVETFFEQHDDDSADDQPGLRVKIDLLRSIGARHLTPSLRDRLAMLLADVGESDGAREVLVYQRDRGTASGRTYAILARLANFRNDFVEFKALVPLLHQHAVTDRDRARAHAHETLLHLRLDEYEAALRSAEPMYRFAVTSGNLELHVLALTRLSYCHQMMGHLDEAMQWAHEAIKLVRSNLNASRFGELLSPIYDSLGDMLKDAGRHEEALSFVREALALATDRSSAGQQQAVESSVGYLYNTRGLIYNELGRFEEAIENFEKSIEEFGRVENRAGLLMPLTYICYPLYRLGRYERIERSLHSLRLVISRSAAVLGDYTEYQSYLPLAEGLCALGKGNRDEAARAFARMRFKGAMTYDSALLAQLYLCQLSWRRQALRPEQVRRLLELLDARGAEQDATAIMFADEFRDLYTACTKMDCQPERFTRVLAAAKQVLPSKARTIIRLTTLGTVSLEVNGERLPTPNNYPIYVLAYLALHEEPVTAERLGDELWTGKANGTRTARSAVSMLRTTFSETDGGLEAVMLVGKADRSGQTTYTLCRKGAWDIELDAAAYLSPRFSPKNPDRVELWALLERCHRFLPRMPESRFVQDVNQEVLRRAHLVAEHLAQQCDERGERRRAAHALLLALRCDLDWQIVDRLERLAVGFDARDRGEIEAYLRVVRHPATCWEAILRQAQITLTNLFGERVVLPS